MKYRFLVSFVLVVLGLKAQQYGYWQQSVDYEMDIRMDVETYRYEGTQRLTYNNNSLDTLSSVYYHLYFNAFQPGSEMDARVSGISDPDMRMVREGKSRIANLSPDEIGYIKVKTLSQNGVPLKYKVEGTVLEVTLDTPISPGKTSVFDMNFHGQVPLQIRRSGRNSMDGVALSMTQWYPKMAEYDYEGWHADPYIGREFHGVWGNYDVKITIDKDYIIGSSGYLKNPNTIGFGYENEGKRVKKTKNNFNTWHFVAPNVHDFAWAADKDFLHDKVITDDGITLHFIYKNNDEIKGNWQKIQPVMARVMGYFSDTIGKYPWKTYSFINGGDGGMEYAMCTLISRGGNYRSLEGTAIHELAHSWFQHILATNESDHPWMDEGFTSYISKKAKYWLNDDDVRNPFWDAYGQYRDIVNSGSEEPLTTHSDHYKLNYSYSVGAYVKGKIFLSQLGYIMGQDNLEKTLRRYYESFKFKHPTPNDIIRTAERVSGMHLGWYRNEWIETTHVIDYAVDKVERKDKKTEIRLKRIGSMPMPIEVIITQKNGDRVLHYIPLRMLRKDKTQFDTDKVVVEKDWAWAYPEYTFEVDIPFLSIKSVVIDIDGLMADIVRKNNIYIVVD